MDVVGRLIYEVRTLCPRCGNADQEGAGKAMRNGFTCHEHRELVVRAIRARREFGATGDLHDLKMVDNWREDDEPELSVQDVARAKSW